MNLLVDKDMFVMYLTNCLVRTKNKTTSNLIQVFENEDNIFLLSELMIERIENELSGKPSLLYEFQGFIQSLGDDKRYLPQNVNEKIESEEIIKIFENNSHNDYMFVFIKQEKNDYKSISNQCCFWGSINKPNKDWLILSFASNRQINVRYSDFVNDRQIKQFFIDYFRFNYKSKNVTMLDSYCHLHRHDLFDSIRNNGHIISVFTSSFNKKPFEVIALRKSIKGHFSKTTTVKFSSDKTLIHERTIMIDDFVLEVNHDFAEIMRRNRNWKIDITYDTEIRLENENKCQAYN